MYIHSNFVLLQIGLGDCKIQHQLIRPSSHKWLKDFWELISAYSLYILDDYCLIINIWSGFHVYLTPTPLPDCLMSIPCCLFTAASESFEHTVGPLKMHILQYLLFRIRNILKTSNSSNHPSRTHALWARAFPKLCPQSWKHKVV